MRRLVSKAHACLPPAYRIRKLSFDRAGWDAPLLTWLQAEQGIVPITWVKGSSRNSQQLKAVDEAEFVPVTDNQLPLGKSDPQPIVQVADTTLDFANLGTQRVVVLQTDSQKRAAIYPTAPHPRDLPLADTQAMSTVSLLNTMRYKQRIENRFKVEVHEMDSDALPSQQIHQAQLSQAYDLAEAQKQVINAQRRLTRYTLLEQQQQQLQATGQLDKHQFNLLQQRSQKLRQKAEKEIETLSQEMADLEQDENGQAVQVIPTAALDVRKLTLLNLFKLHALVALKVLAGRLGLAEAGPERLRRSFLAFGQRVEFDHDRHIVTVYAAPFPRAPMQQAYERLCSDLHDVPITLTRQDVSYRVRFSW